MRRAIEKFMYGLCWHPIGWIRNAVASIWYHYYCPRPIIDDWTARACNMAGNCGCNNQVRYGESVESKE